MKMFRTCAVAAILLLAGGARADNPFSIQGSDGANTITVGSSNLIDLVNSAINSTAQFGALNPNAPQNFALNYGGVANAITISKNATNTSATLTFGPTGVTRTFTGANAADLQKQIEDYLKGAGSSDVKDFLKALNKLSLIAVSDGNPNSTTARLAEFSYNRFGFFGEEAKAYLITKEGKIGDAGTQFQLGLTGKAFETGNFTGKSATLSTAFTVNFSQTVGLSMGSFVSWNTIEDADVYHVGFNLGVPIRIIVPEAKTGVLWQVTPFLATAGSGSVDMAAGGLVTGFGGVSLLSWKIDEKWTVAMANQIARYSGYKLEYQGYSLDPGVDQVMLKNGLRGSFRFSEGWSVYGGATLSNYLNDAAVKSWVSPEVGVMYDTPAGSGVEIGFTGDFGSDYKAYGIRALFMIAF